MLAAALEDRFQAALGDAATPERATSIRFAVAFAQLLVRILPDVVPPEAAEAVARAVAARTELSPSEIEVLLRLAFAPEHRTEVAEEELAAFGARFGVAAEEAMRAAVADELDLEGFSTRYGPAEALLLLDSLFAVCAVDGRIDPSEIGRLQQAARRLGVDPMLVGLLFRRHDPRHASGQLTFDLSAVDEVLIGRDAPAQVRLPDPQVAVRHARLQRTAAGWRLMDLGSGRPTLLRGHPISSSPLGHGEEFRVGPYRLVLSRGGDTLVVFGAEAISALSVRGVSRELAGPHGPIRLLDDLSFTVFSGEVVAMVGPSGAGKTTLLQAIAGIAPPDDGEIRFDHADFHTMLASDRSVVGIVPQDDVLHGELTVREALRYAARLRLPPDTASDAVEASVDRVLAELALTAVQDQRIGTSLARGISGGQRKRVNLGQELLTRTTRVLFLDEPTSGLDPHTAQDIVTEVRQLADDGRVAFLVTHDVSPGVLALVDHLLVLAPGGRLAWFGPPREALAHFQVASVDAIFGVLPTRPPEHWRDAYLESAAWRKYVRTREHLVGLSTDEPSRVPPASTPRTGWLQYTTLTGRYARVKARDWVGTGVLLAQAPLLALAFALVFPAPQTGTLFVTVLSSLWFGASVAVRELIAERPIWRREARVGVRLLPYVASKVTVLSAIVSVQCVSLVSLLYVALGMGDYGFSWVGLASVSTATGLVGMTLGLLVSATFSSNEAAVGTLPLVLIPQIAFGGLLVKIKEMSVLAKAVTWLMVTRFGFEAALKTGERVQRPGMRGTLQSDERVVGTLWDLGFRATADVSDMGLTPVELGGILATFAATFLIAATWLTGRAREGS